jgi:membrane-associated phospholipid phosphatase
MEFLATLDADALTWFGEHHAEWLTPIMFGLTRMGDAAVLLVMAAAGAAAFAAAGYRMTGLLFLAGALACLGTEYALKQVVQRERPNVAWRLSRGQSTWSFPSGHSANSMAVYGSAALLLARRRRLRWQRALLAATGILLCICIGISRLYLGAHYLSDVLGGWTVGLTSALIVLVADWRLASNVPAGQDPADRPFVV